MRSCFLLFSLFSLSSPAFAQLFRPDSLFGNSGMVVTPETGKTSVTYDVALQPDGKIVAAGMIYDNDDADMNFHTYLIRYNANGTIDHSFGVNGRVKTEAGTKDIAYAVAIQPDGKIVVAGNETVIFSIDSTSATIISRPYLIRYNSSGSIDNAFGTNGIHRLDLLNTYVKKYVNTLAIRPDGTILVGGGVAVGQFYEMLAVSLNPNGSYTTGFGTGGMARVPIEAGQDATLNDIALQADGKLIIAGSSGAATLTAPPNTKVALARLLLNGSPDPGFGSAGKVVTAISTAGTPYDVAQSVKLQSDGKIVAAGASDKSLALLRYLSNGTLDAGFGTGGIVVSSNLVPAQNLYIDHNGKLLTSGLKASQDPYSTNIILARHNNNGTPDLGFGNAGELVIDKSNQDNAYALIGQPDHKIILGGHTIDAASQHTSFTLFRYTEAAGGTGIDHAGTAGYQVNLYPNPATSALNLLFDQQPKTEVAFRIVNAVGQLCYEGYTKKTLTTVPTAALASGFYLLHIGTGSETKTLKFDIRK